jgi:translation initiation factor 1
MKKRSPRSGGMVYSTELGRTCPTCRRSLHQCACSGASAPLGDGRVRVSRDTKGRGGKGVTVITGLPLAPDALDQLATALKKRCGSGGTVKNGAIEIQGEHRDTVMEELTRLGYAPKRAGG